MPGHTASARVRQLQRPGVQHGTGLVWLSCMGPVPGAGHQVAQARAMKAPVLVSQAHISRADCVPCRVWDVRGSRGLPAFRDRLAQLAAEHGTTIRSLVEDLAQSTPTQAEYAERAELARAELASALDSAPSPEAEAKARALLERLGATPHGPRAAA